MIGGGSSRCRAGARSLIIGAGIGNHVDRADLDGTIARARSLDLDLMSVMGLQHRAIALQIHALAVVGGEHPVPA